MININNTQVVMNQIVDKLNECRYDADRLKVDTEQTQVKDVKKEVEHRVEKKKELDRHITRVISKSKWSI